MTIRTILAVCAVVGLSLYAAEQLYQPGAGVVDPFGTMRLVQRFQPLRAALPPDTLLGYVSDVPPDAATIFGLEYAIAPRLLVQDSVPHRYVLGNFSQPVDSVEFGRARGLRLVREFPFGAVLYEKDFAP